MNGPRRGLLDQFLNGQVKVHGEGGTMVTSCPVLCLNRHDVMAHIQFRDRRPHKLVVSNAHQSLEFEFKAVGNSDVYQLWRGETCVATVVGTRIDLVLVQKLLGEVATDDLRLMAYRGGVTEGLVEVIEEHFPTTAAVVITGGGR